MTLELGVNRKIWGQIFFVYITVSKCSLKKMAHSAISWAPWEFFFYISHVGKQLLKLFKLRRALPRCAHTIRGYLMTGDPSPSESSSGNQELISLNFVTNLNLNPIGVLKWKEKGKTEIEIPVPEEFSITQEKVNLMKPKNFLGIFKKYCFFFS